MSLKCLYLFLCCPCKSLLSVGWIFCYRFPRSVKSIFPAWELRIQTIFHVLFFLSASCLSPGKLPFPQFPLSIRAAAEQCDFSNHQSVLVKAVALTWQAMRFFSYSPVSLPCWVLLNLFFCWFLLLVLLPHQGPFPINLSLKKKLANRKASGCTWPKECCTVVWLCSSSHSAPQPEILVSGRGVC